MEPGMIGGIVGGLLGLLGGVIGTYSSISSTRGPLERRVMIRCSVACWMGIILFLGLMFTLPGSYRHFLWLPYVLLLPLGASIMNRKVREARELEEGTEEIGVPKLSD